MSVQKDPWQKSRSPGNHFTAAEIARLRVAFNTMRHPREIAQELKCSLRNANKYYAIFRGVPKKPKVVQPKIIKVAPEPKFVPKPRFYKSNFELDPS